MSRFKELVKSSAAILLSQATMAIISILFLSYFARVFSKQEMGLLALLSTLAIWLQTIGGMGLNTLANKDIAGMIVTEEFNDVKRFVSSVIVYRIAGIFIIGLICFIGSSAIARLCFGHTDYIRLIRLVIIASFFASCYASLLGILQALQLFYVRSLLDFGTAFGQRLLGVIGFLIYGIYGFFAAYLIATIICTGFGLFRIRSYLTLHVLTFPKVLKQSMGYWGIDIFRGVLHNIDQPIVASFLGAEVLGGYYVAKRIYNKAGILVTSIVMPAGAKFGEVKAEGKQVLRGYFRNTITMAGYLFVPLGFFIAATGKPALILYASEKYISFAPVTVIFGFTLIVHAFWTLLRAAALRLVSARYFMYTYISSSVVTLLSYAVLLPRMGVIGIPIAMGIGFMAGNILVVHQLRKSFALELPIKELLLGICCGLCFLIFGVAAVFTSNMVLQLISITVLSTALYIAWMYFWGPVVVKQVLRKICARIPFVSVNT